jgi:flagellar basal-body rod protein FlgC
MNLFGVMDVTGSALKAERVRAEVVASNMANAETTRTATGGPYQRQQVVFQQAGSGFADAMQSQGISVGGSSVASNAGIGFASFGGALLDSGTAGGVEVAGVVTDKSAPVERYDPGHPDADENGFVAYPDINPLTEMVDLMGATRAYGMNASALQAEKGMLTASLEILK